MEIKATYSALKCPAYACRCPACDSVYQWGLVQHPLVDQTQTLHCQFCDNTSHVIWTGKRWRYYEPQLQCVPDWIETRWESYYLVWLLKGMKILRQRVADVLARTPSSRTA